MVAKAVMASAVAAALMAPTEASPARRACPTQTVAESHRVVGYRTPGGELRFCIRSTAARRELPLGIGFAAIYPGFSITGRVVALAFFVEGSGTEPVYTFATVWDLAPRTPRLLTTTTFEFNVGAVAADPRGNLLYAECPQLSWSLDVSSTDGCRLSEAPELRFAPRPARRPRFPGDYSDNRVVASGRRIDPLSVRWRRGRFEWREGARTRTFRP